MFKILGRFFKFCQAKYCKKFYLSIVLGLFIAIFEAMKIPAIAVMTDALLNDNVTSKTCIICLVIMLVSILGSSLARNKSTMLQTEGGYGACADKRIDIARHLRYLPMGYYNKTSLGKVMSVCTNTMQNLENVATRVVMMVTSGLLTTAVITVMMFIFDWRIGLILTAGLVLFFIVNSRIVKSSEEFADKKVEKDSILVSKVIEYIQGISEVKSYGLTGKKTMELDRANENAEKANSAMELALIPLMTIQDFVLKIIGTVMTFASIAFYLNDTLSLLYCIVMIISSFIIYSSLETAGKYSALLRVVDTSVHEVQTILDTPQMDIDGEDINPEHFDLDAEHLDFSYDQKKILDDISLHISEHSTTAIVGPSGGGKTTLTQLLSRFWDADAGTVRLGGKDVRKYSMDSLMKNYSFVFQNVYLFHDTIANNIRFGQPDAPMERVIDAAKKACCHEFITALPQGYDTVIGEGGADLSGGEKQRISIARAIMKNAPIIILDEATANVDPENEAELVEAVNALTKEKTIIMIAHRLKTVRHADNILVIDKGRIAQQGTHEQLVVKDGIYRHFIKGREKAVSWKL